MFTRGRAPWRYLAPLKANLFLSANADDVSAAIDAGIPAARVFPESVKASESHPDEIRIAFDGDAVLFSDESERVFQSGGLDAFQRHEADRAALPLPPGPFAAAEALHRCSGRTRLARTGAGAGTDPHRAGDRAQRRRTNARSNADALGIEVEGVFLGGSPSGHSERVRA